MKVVWMTKRFVWNPIDKEYEVQYDTLHTSSIKARHAATTFIDRTTGSKRIETEERSKSFYTLSSGDNNAYCIVSRYPVD